MGRRYVVTFEQVSVSVAQDLLQIKGAAGKMLKILRMYVNPSNTTLVTAQSISCRGRFLPATVTDGSGGSTPTPQKVDPGDAAASFTALANNTVKATSSGTAVIMAEVAAHIYAGVDFSWRPGGEPTVGPSTSFVFELLSTVSGTVSLSGGVEVEEIGG